MGETYINPHEVQNHSDSGNTPASSSTIATIDGSVDEPPIRSAGSSHYLTEKSGGETRYIEKPSTLGIHQDHNDIATCAHADSTRILSKLFWTQRLMLDVNSF